MRKQPKSKEETLKSIKNWPEMERPREQLFLRGPSVLSDAQLLAIILRTGHQPESAVDLGLKLLKRYGSLSSLASTSPLELCSIPGVGPAKAAQIRAALELGRRTLSKPLKRGLVIQGSSDIYLHYHPILRDLKKEVFMILLLDTKHRVLDQMTISTGSLNLNIVHPREVFHAAVRQSAAAVIVLHNHPSGDPTPSEEDIELTDRLVRAGEVMGIKVLDHIIIGDGQYLSFSEKGLLSRMTRWKPDISV